MIYTWLVNDFQISDTDARIAAHGKGPRDARWLEVRAVQVQMGATQRGPADRLPEMQKPLLESPAKGRKVNALGWSKEGRRAQEA